MFPISLKLTDKERHDYILKTFILNQKTSVDQRKHKRDIDVIRENHRFLWNEDDETVQDEISWELRLAKRYYDKLFKEYCIADLTRYKENKIALRWRTEDEVVEGKGQFVCGSRKCTEKSYLRSWEVNFAYKEQGEAKNALVKLRLCPDHSEQLNYFSKKREIKRLKHTERQNTKNNKRLQRKAKKVIQANVGVGGRVEGDDEDNGLRGKTSLSEDNENNDEDMSEEYKDTLEVTEEVWNKKPQVEIESVSRETEFERYLEDLLL